tara:strand:- start:52 stop:2829 length:2778 start_codon:yes stop_codon:yes gene_type:complete
MAISVITGKEMSDDNPYAASASGVGFTSPYAAKMLPPEQQQEQYVAEAVQAAAEKVHSEEGLDLEDIEMTARAFIDGLWFNKSEEVGASVAAFAVSVLNPEIAKRKSFDQIKAEMLSELEADTARFEEDSPWAAGISNVAGGIMNPVSLAGGQLLAGAYKLRQGVQATRVADDVALTLGGRFATQSDDAAKLAAQYGAQQAAGKTGTFLSSAPIGAAAQRLATAQVGAKGLPLVGKIPLPLVVPGAGLAAAEGAVFGYEGSNDDEKAANALFTAGISAAVPLGWSGLKQGYGEISKSRLAQQVGEGSDFVSLMFTEHALAPVYKYVVSKAYGGTTLMEQQARKVAGKALTPASAKQAINEIELEAAKKTAAAKRTLKAKTTSKADLSLLNLDVKIAQAKEEALNSADNVKWRHEEAISLYEKAKVDVQAAKVVAVKDADAAVSAAEAGFRGQALRQAAPPGASADEINLLGSLDPHDANIALDDLWTKYGFKVGADYRYTVDPKGALNYIDITAKKYPELSLIGGEKGNIISVTKKYINQVLDDAPEEMSGSELLQIGSDLGRAVSALSENAPSARKFATEMQDYFHEILESKLSKEEIAKLSADRTAWSVKRLVDDSIGGASGRSGATGNFTPKDWLASVKGYSTRFAARGTGRLQKEAEAIEKISQANKQNILDLADDEAKATLKSAIEGRREALASLLQTKKYLTKQRNEEIARLKKEQIKTKTGTKGREGIDLMLIEAKEKFSVQLADGEALIQKTTQEMESLKDIMPSTFKASVFEKLFNTALIGQVLAPASMTDTIGSSLLSGGIGARILADEATQRVLAGQSNAQASMRKLSDRLSSTLDVSGPVGPSMAQTTGGQAALSAQIVAPQGETLSAKDKEKISNLPRAAKARVYRILESDGRLERIKIEDVKFYNELKKAS